ncbi:MAG: N-acetylmuramoyl-L-alanine amidase [Cyanobacteria bacterium J06627_3]
MIVDLTGTEPDACQTSIPSLPDGVLTILSGKVVVLDPGHGEFQGSINDPGAVNGGLGRNERDEVRKQADIIKANLEKKGATVRIIENNTRKTLNQIGSEGRGADCFVSLHLNAFNRRVQGHEVFVHTGGTPTDERLATLINQELATVLPINNRGVKRLGLGVLRGVPLPVPAVLTEGFFIDSVGDAATLDEWNTLAAKAIATGIEKFLTAL